MKTQQISPYKIYWHILIPITGKATKKDTKNLDVRIGKTYRKFNRINNLIIDWSIYKEFATNANLSKTYQLVTITDKQFGMMKSIDKDSVLAIATTMQKKNIRNIC